MASEAYCAKHSGDGAGDVCGDCHAEEVASLRAALETAERRRAETAAGAKREFDRMRNERDEARTEAEALLSHIQRVASGAYAGMLFSLPWVDHSKGADDGE